MPNDQQPLDFSYLIEMVGNDPAFLIDFFETFTTQSPLYLAEMSEALVKENWSKVAHCAHKIKPTLSYFGRDDVKDFVQTIEDRARNRIALDEIYLDVEKLKLVFSDIFSQLEKEKVNLISKL
jgi:HPt (histidine-containing phosphotransfer) domain-containing protein